MTRSSLLVVAGEVSGDIHAANLVDALLSIEPATTVFGIGGERLLEVGLEAIATTDELAHMGLVEVLRELPRLRGILERVVAEAARRRPHGAVLVDSPDFNLRLAARLRREGIPVILYVSPQIWAWRKGRVRIVRRVADEVLCILPFEVGFYEAAGVTARFVGHPLVDDIARDGLLQGHGERAERRLALLPGSRAMEVRQLLPTMIETLRRLPRDAVDDAVLVEAPGVGGAVDDVLETTGSDPRLRRVRGRARRETLAGSRLAWTASGTATLECALLDVLPVVGYRLQPVTYLLARMLVRVPHVALLNLIAGRRVAPELIQGDWNPDRLARTTIDLLTSGRDGAAAGLAEVRRRLGPPGASRRAAEAVLEHLRRNSGGAAAGSPA